MTRAATFGVHVSYRQRRDKPLFWRDFEAQRIVCAALKKRSCPRPDSGFCFPQRVRDLEFDAIPGYRMSKPEAERVAGYLREHGFKAKVTRSA